MKGLTNTVRELAITPVERRDLVCRCATRRGLIRITEREEDASIGQEITRGGDCPWECRPIAKAENRFRARIGYECYDPMRISDSSKTSP
jgi:hypothetical protein